MNLSIRSLLLPLTPLYEGIVQMKRWLYERGFLKQRHLNHPVISIGSLSAGGAGKTPVVLLFAELLVTQGFEVRILTRGYGRVGKITERVDPNGNAAQYGDEPLLLARQVPQATVFVGRDRYRAGVLAERNDTADTKAIYLLDDGFQHQKLARDNEVLLITRQELHDRLLPAGNLREPLRSICKADLLILREEEYDLADILPRHLPFELPPVVTVRRQLEIPVSGHPERPLIFSGLARPEGFVTMLKEHGFDTTRTKVFPDHHRYSNEDIERLVTSAKECRADGFITTEKDAVKLTKDMLKRLETVGPVIVANLELELVDGASTIDSMISHLVSRTI